MSLQQKELWKKFLLGALALSMGLLAMSNFVHSLGIFLLDLGPEQLPYSILAVSVLVFAHSVLNVFAAERVKADKIFAAAILFFIANYTALLFLPPGSYSHSFYFFVIGFLILWLQEGFLTQFTSSVMTPLQSKRYLPFVFGFMNFGLVIGALFVEPYKWIHELVGIGTLPIAGFGLVLLLIMVSGRLYRQELSETLQEAHKVNLLDEIQKGGRYIFSESRLYRLIALAVILFVGVHISIDFKLKVSLAESFGHGTLTETLGLVYMVRSLGAWFMSSFLVRRLLFHFGVSNMMIFYPATIVLAGLAAIVFQLHYIAVIALFLVFSLSYYSYYDICMSQMLAVVPKVREHGVHFIIHGLLYSLGMMAFSLLLLLYTRSLALEATINTAVILVASAILVALFMTIKRFYFAQLKANLHGDDEFLKLRSIDLFAEAASIQRGEDYLRRMLELPTLKGNVKARVIGSLGVIGNYQTIVDLTKVVRSDPDPKMKSEAIHAINSIITTGEKLDRYPVTKHYLLRTYEQILLSSVPSYVKAEVIAALKYFDLEDVMRFLENHLHDENAEVRQNVIRTLAAFRERGIIPYLEPFLDDENFLLQREAIIALWQFPEMRVRALPRLAGILASSDPASRESALTIIGSIHAQWEKPYVHRQLEKGDEHARLHALVTLVELGDTQHLQKLTRKMLQLARRGHTEELEFVLRHYRTFPDFVRQTMIRMIQEMKEEDSRAMCEAFKNSKFVFAAEVAALS